MEGSLLSALLARVDAFAASVSPLASRTTFLRIPVLASALDALSHKLGYAEDLTVIPYVFGLLAAFPLALIYRQLTAPIHRHAFSAVAGVWLLQQVYGAAWLHFVAQGGVAWALLAATAGTRSIARPLLVLGWLVAYVAALHAYAMHTDYLGWRLDVTGPTMVLCIKLSRLAFALHDGGQRAAYAARAAGGGRSAALYARRLARARDALPPPLALLGFAFCFASILAGPAFDFHAYEAAGGAKPRSERAALLGAGAGLRKLSLGLAFLAITVALGQPWSVIAAIDSGALAARPLLLALPLAWLCLVITRTKYFFAWLIAEGAANLAGFGHRRSPPRGAKRGGEGAPEPLPRKSGEDGSAAAADADAGGAGDDDDGDWSGVANIDVLNFEAASSISAASRAWNMQTQAWLEDVAYSRVTHDWSLNLAATYALSAAWHGFYPGYFFSFGTLALFTLVEKQLSSKLLPRIRALGSAALDALADAAARLLTALAMTYSFLAFVSLSGDRAIRAWAPLSYVGHLAAVGLLAALVLVPAAKATPKADAASGGVSAAAGSSDVVDKKRV